MREFRKTTGRGATAQVWYIWQEEDSYFVKWGQLGGALQETSDRPGDCGVSGYSDYQTPSQYALFCMNREIRKKLEQGYVEYVDDEPLNSVATAIDFSKPLPKNLCFYKPQLKIEQEDLEKLVAAGRAIWTLKRDGMCHISCKRNGEWEIYSRRMDLVTDHYPHIVEKLRHLEVGDGTILIGEMVLLNPDGRDNFKAVSKICRSKKDLSLAYQGLGDFPKNKKDESVVGKIKYYVFDMPFLNGTDLVSNFKVRDRLENIFEVICKDCEPFVIPLDIIDNLTTKNDLDIAKQLGIEGWVIMDADATYGDKGYSFDGKARRPNGIYKRKAKLEDEFIISGVYEGSGRNRGRFGGFLIQQIHPETGERIDCGKCGGGFSDEHRDSFLNEDLIGQTIKVEFDSRQPNKDGAYALRFPVYKSFSDKTPEECIAQNLEEDE